MNAAAEVRALLGVVAVIAAVGVVSSVAGIADHIAADVLLDLANPPTTPATTPPGGTP